VLITPRELELHRIVVAKTYAPGALDYRGMEVRQITPLRVKAVAELVGEEIRIQGDVETRIEAACDRCLAPFEIPVELKFDLIYRPVSTIAREEEIELPDDELDVGFYEGEGIQLGDVITEQVILSLPMKVICNEDCRGLCPTCGADRNREPCRCQEMRADSPFAALRGD
jgi:uncharacterized protein